MAKWTTYYKIVTPKALTTAMTDSQYIGDQASYGAYTWYQHLIQGSASRISRYREYDLMDYDIDVNRAIDTIAEEVTGNNTKTEDPITIEAATEDEMDARTVATLDSALKKWIEIHEFKTKIFKIARAMVKYGDVFFLRKNVMEKWEHLHAKNVVAALVDQNDMTKVIGWQIKQDTKKPGGGLGQSQFYKTTPEYLQLVKADKVIRFTINDDMSEAAPFGESVLRPVYKTFKQKELLEDAVLIYRIQRAPERRVFYIDVGRMPANRVKQYLEGIKNEIKQKKVPGLSIDGRQDIESVYNPQSMCLGLETEIPLLDGRILTLQELIGEHENGKQNWAYSINPETGEVVPGLISWAGITRRHTETIKLTFDNGDHFIATPDHKIPIQGKGFIEAKDITEDDSLFPFITRNALLENKKKYEYQQVFDSASKQWIFTHRLVGSFMKSQGRLEEFIFAEGYIEKPKQTIHHKDFDRFNNNPDNLVLMNSQDHILYHQSQRNESFLSYIKNLTGDERREHFAKAGKALARSLRGSSELLDKFVRNLRSNAPSFKNQKLIFNRDLFDHLYNIVSNDINISFFGLLEYLNNDEIFMDKFSALNSSSAKTKEHLKNYCNKVQANSFSQKAFVKLISFGGYNNFEDIRDKIIQLKISRIRNNYRVEPLNTLLDFVERVSSTGCKLINFFRSNDTEWNEFINVINKETGRKVKRPDYSILDRLSYDLGYSSYKDLIYGLALSNHKIVKIEKCENQDTGTLTIDKDEIHHNYHTFAISHCFVRNSEDYYIAQRCLKTTTYIPLLDGRTLTLADIIKEYEDGKENFVYSVDQEIGKFIPGEIEWAGITRKNAVLVRVYLDNDEYIDCTPDHKFVMRDGTEVEAQYLQSGNSLMSHASDNHKVIKIEWLAGREDTGCLTIKDPGQNHNFAVAAGVYVKNSDGKGSKVEVLPGGQALGELSDLDYFYDKMYRGLRIPSSYMKQGQDNAIFNDGKVGVAYIQELRFSLFVERLQGYIEKILDEEFKKFIKSVGIYIEETLYNLRLPEPSNFGKYRQQEVDTALLGTYGTADAVPYLSKRFIMRRYLQLEEDEIVENEELVAKEKGIDYNSDAPEESWPMIYGGGLGEEGLGGAGMGGVPPAGDMGAPLGPEGEMTAGAEGGAMAGPGGPPAAPPPA